MFNLCIISILLIGTLQFQNMLNLGVVRIKKKALIALNVAPEPHLVSLEVQLLG